MPELIKVEFEKSGIAYQMIEHGHVMGYVNEKGDGLEGFPPIGEGCCVVECDPKVPDEVVARIEKTHLPYDVDASGDRRRMKRRKSDSIDHRALLTKYMAHVESEDGFTLTSRLGDEFTAVEVEELQAIAKAV